MIKTHGLTHLSLSVRDPDRSLAFYRELFGVREYHREENSIQVLGPGPHDVIVGLRRGESQNFSISIPEGTEGEHGVRVRGGDRHFAAIGQVDVW